MNCLLGFFLGFAVCAVGVMIALMFDLGLDRLGALWKRLSR